MISTRWRMPAGRSAMRSSGSMSQAVLLADLADPLAYPARVEAPDVAERHVLPDGERLDEAEVLVHHGDAVLGGVDRVDDLHGCAVQPDLAGVGQDEADQDLHQRRLAGAVLAEDAVDAPTVQREVDAVAGDDPPEPLGDADQLHGGRRGVDPPPASLVRGAVMERRSALGERLGGDLLRAARQLAAGDLGVDLVHRRLLLGGRVADHGARLGVDADLELLDVALLEACRR